MVDTRHIPPKWACPVDFPPNTYTMASALERKIHEHCRNNNQETVDRDGIITNYLPVLSRVS